MAAVAAMALLLPHARAFAQDQIGTDAQVGHRGAAPDRAVFVPRVSNPPRIEDFASMRPPSSVRLEMAVVEGFVQRIPRDGQPASLPTRAYLGYDAENLYVVFVAFDDQPDAVRARMSRREDIEADDQVSILIDTFRDQQRGYEFTVNPLGIQRDGLWTEGRDLDVSFDTLWHSSGMLTAEGYVAALQIPFKSLRFPRRDVQTWGLVLSRRVPRGATEESTWPAVSSRIEGRLNQAGAITGLADVSAGRNLRLIPYGTFRSFRALDSGRPAGPGFVTDPADPAVGIDAKFVLKDSIVFDATFNPDFSQVESDQPQTTANRRFEVFFPEKRPFFLENANLFETPINLLFTRRIADPQFGLRASGKLGAWTLGALAIDDQAPGRAAPPGDDLHGARAGVGVLRISRDVGGQSNVGALFVDRRLRGGFNRVGGVDARVKLNRNWVATLQAVGSSTESPTSEALAGSAFVVRLDRAGRTLNVNLSYLDVQEDFRALTGFVPRVGVRQSEGMITYSFRPEGDTLIAHGPGYWHQEVYGRDGTRLDRSFNPWWQFDLAGNTLLGAFFWRQQTRLRPEEFGTLPADRDYVQDQYGVWLDSQLLRQIELNLMFNFGTALNFVPAPGHEPETGRSREGRVGVTYRPNTRLRLSALWLYSGLDGPAADGRAFRSDILRSRLDLQLSRELSLRLIAQYDALASDPGRTSLEDRRNLNADVLLTYLVNPWTSVYLGLNRNDQNLQLLETERGSVLRRGGRQLFNDSRQLFLKVSYLFSY